MSARARPYTARERRSASQQIPERPQSSLAAIIVPSDDLSPRETPRLRADTEETNLSGPPGSIEEEERVELETSTTSMKLRLEGIEEYDVDEEIGDDHPTSSFHVVAGIDPLDDESKFQL